jgi:hypothetical protein
MRFENTKLESGPGSDTVLPYALVQIGNVEMNGQLQMIVDLLLEAVAVPFAPWHGDIMETIGQSHMDANLRSVVDDK